MTKRPSGRVCHFTSRGCARKQLVRVSWCIPTLIELSATLIRVRIGDGITVTSLMPICEIRYPDIYVGYGSGPADSICMIVLKTSPFITPTGEAFGPTSSMDGQTHLHTQWAFSSPHFKTCASWRLKEASWCLEMLPFGIISSLAQSWRICRIWKRTTLIIPGSGLPDSTSTRPLRPGLKCHNSSRDVQKFYGSFTACPSLTREEGSVGPNVKQPCQVAPRFHPNSLSWQSPLSVSRILMICHEDESENMDNKASM